MRSLTAVAFDLDDTLIDRSEAVARWLDDITGGEGCEDLIRLDGGGYGDRPTFFAALCRRTGWVASAARARYRAGVLDRLTLRPGAAELLERLAQEDCALAIATNGSVSFQGAKIAAVGLEQRVPLVLISEAVGCSKPDPAFFRLLLERLGSRPAATLMVGNHPTDDILGGHRAGLLTCWVRSHRHAAPAHATWIVDCLSQVPAP
jgi:putative hydrolase of the HAD superfamily